MRIWIWGFILCLIACSTSSEVVREEQKILLITAEKALKNKGNLAVYKAFTTSLDKAIKVDTTTIHDAINENNLKVYSTIVLLGIDADSLTPQRQNAIERYVQAGGGLILSNVEVPKSYVWSWLTELFTQEFSPDESFPVQRFEYDGGRILCLAMEDTHYLKESINYSIGKNSYDYSKTKTPLAPDFSRFTKKTLDDDIYEPMEMVILPDLRVLFIERRGKMKLYDPTKAATEVVHNFDVCMEGNYEDGLLGLALDPDYGKSNHYLYMYYSPPCANTNQLLSRFIFKEDSLYVGTEKVILEVKVQREQCCHSGGSVEFGMDGLLYLSTGDNTSSKESDGFTPIDERPGRGPFDAQKSSANTHDLRGKILRIRLKEDGSYDIPDGNLFPKDGSKGRPEIFVMGCRNPFRIAIDKRGWVYWGDVGPDGGENGIYGPQSYDEWNQAKVAGNFGWPYFVGDNLSYADRDFEMDTIGKLFDPKNPINESPYNTGSKYLPPAQPAMIWYPYGKSIDFPHLGIGSRSSMAGPFYYESEANTNSSTKFPSYYDDKFFIYEWGRNWINVVSFDKNGDLAQIEPFMSKTYFSRPIDMQFGPDGAMYLLEYGEQYFLNNPQAKLTRVEYAQGNRLPIPKIMADKPYGTIPHKVDFSAANSIDYDVKDSLKYEWFFTDSKKVQAEGKEVSFVFEENGIFDVKLQVTDSQRGSATTTIPISIGNEPASIDIKMTGNSSFFFDNKINNYAITINDLEDEEIGQIDSTKYFVSTSFSSDIDYLKKVVDGKINLSDAPIVNIEGQRLINDSDCSTCHHPTKRAIGPSYKELYDKYDPDGTTIEMLVNKVIKGGGGVWGEKLMAAHPQLLPEEVTAMIEYILTIEDGTLPLNAPLVYNQHKDHTTGGYLVAALYKDKGANGIKPITSRSYTLLQHPKVQAEAVTAWEKGTKSTFGVGLREVQINIRNGGYLKYEKIDLTGINSLSIRLTPNLGGKLLVKIDGIDGTTIGTLKIPKVMKDSQWKTFNLPLKATKGKHDLYLVADCEDNNWWGIANLDWIFFRSE